MASKKTESVSDVKGVPLPMGIGCVSVGHERSQSGLLSVEIDGEFRGWATYAEVCAWWAAVVEAGRRDDAAYEADVRAMVRERHCSRAKAMDQIGDSVEWDDLSGPRLI